MARATDGARESALGKPLSAPTGAQRVDRPAPRPARLQIRPLPRVWTTTAQFLRDVRAEMDRVAWPDRQTVIASTVVTVFVLVVTAMYLAGWDYVFAGLFSYLFKR